jgi:hypothetical protein
MHPWESPDGIRLTISGRWATAFMAADYNTDHYLKVAKLGRDQQ